MPNDQKGHRQRLKQRFLTGEPQARTDEALLELLLTYAIPQKDVQPLARQLIADFGSLRAVLSADRSALISVNGLGDAAIALLTLVGHLGTVPHAAATRAIDPAPLAETTIPRDNRPERAGDTARARLPAAATATGDGTTSQLADNTAMAPQTAGPLMGAAALHPVPAAPRPAAGRPRRAAPAKPAATSPPDPAADPATRWRATGRFSAANMLKPGMVAETQIALAAFARLRDLAATRRYLQDEGLPQRSRASRSTIATAISERLAAWNPPDWVCEDLIETSAAGDLANLKLLLLIHTARQDTLLYAIVQEVIVPRWLEGVAAISHVEMQRFLDDAAPTHPEIRTWSRATRIKLAGNLLTVLRDYGLLVGAAGKRVIEPVISPFAAGHLARLLRDEGTEAAKIVDHPDWALWLLAPDRVRAVLPAALRERGER